MPTVCSSLHEKLTKYVQHVTLEPIRTLLIHVKKTFKKVISGDFHMHVDHNGTSNNNAGKHLRQLRMEIFVIRWGYRVIFGC